MSMCAKSHRRECGRYRGRYNLCFAKNRRSSMCNSMSSARTCFSSRSRTNDNRIARFSGRRPIPNCIFGSLGSFLRCLDLQSGSSSSGRSCRLNNPLMPPTLPSLLSMRYRGNTHIHCWTNSPNKWP